MADRVGQQLGAYRLVRLLGRGGFAEVYLGEHARLGTQAAIKVLLTQLAGEDDIESFQTEARTIARLAHPNIVRVLDFQVEEGVPYLVMDYAPNGTLRQKLPKGARLDPQTILPSVQQVASALQYAHDEKLVHRDIKPENMLLSRNNDILLSDFGIAVVSQSSRQSTQEVVGTVSYMAPEQIQGHPRPASDQYALGIVIYEWLSGARPFHGSFTEVCSQHLFAAPPPLREKAPDLAAGIEEVVMVALAKDAKNRFASIQAFATAFEQACRESALLSAPTQVARPSGSLVQPASQVTPAAPALASTIVVTPPAPPASSAPSLSAPSTLPSAALTAQERIAFAQTQLARTERAAPASSPIAPPPGIVTRPAGTTLCTYRGHSDVIWAVAWSPDGRRIASAGRDRTVQVWDVATGKTLLTYRRHQGQINAVAWSPDGARIASGGFDKMVHIWDAATGKLLRSYQDHTDAIWSVAWSPSGTHVASSGYDKTARVWDASSGATLLTYRSHTDWVLALAWSPEGARIASTSADKTARVWDSVTGWKRHRTYRGHRSQLWAIDWSPDGSRVASGGTDQDVHVWDTATGSALLKYTNHTDWVFALGWSADGRLIASAGSGDGAVQVWDSATGSTLLSYQGHTDKVLALAWSPPAATAASARYRQIASAGHDSTVQVWQAPTS